ncbi:efflux RND transporter periplasmic adaptor subunit [Gallaecimonas xiamenensis]|uniref:RND family efflux transporter MFP subunit n=1 Tax=Gallaecimonas xiamenensis 3-C-1 TaxID=745411 RepID=K2JBN6_9GAMM|nr:efflux RND transporter periplasmic adaptor subunit [Gallaecimonas xiamenensis]EKE72162.1 RND family efflux transporter MFP subunit [Gallaecimonas xiamenensis 3-C-1]
MGNHSRLFTALPLALVLVACGQPEAEPPAPVVRPVKTFTLGEQGQGPILTFPGSVSAVKQSQLAFEVPGRVVQLAITEGQRVKAGALLARLDPRDYQAQRDRALAERDAAKSDFDRYQKAFAAKAITPQQLDSAKRALEVTEAGLRQAEKALEDTQLRAPFAGRVARKLVEDFANVQAKQPVLLVQSDNELEMRVAVPESDWIKESPLDSADQAAARQGISVVLSALPDKPIPARLSAFSTVADPVTRTFMVKVRFTPPKSLAISPGMTGHVAYHAPAAQQGQGFWVPANAVVAGPEGNPYVWCIDKGLAHRCPVTLGEPSGDRLRVLSGLATGQRIAISGIHSLSEGTAVRPLESRP